MIRLFLAAYTLAGRTGFLDTRIGESTLDYGYYAYKRYVEDPYDALARRHPELFRGGDIVDVGANLGYTASVFAKVLTEGFQVHAFEPEEKNWEGLLRNVRRLGLSNRVNPVRAAVGDRNGTAQFWRNPANHADSRIMTEELSQGRAGTAVLQEVEMITLDSFVRQRMSKAPIRFIKIDVQGFELAVLRGARELLESHDITLSTEVTRNEPKGTSETSEAVIDFLRERAFLPHTVDRRGRIIASSEGRIAEMAAGRGYIDVIWSRRQLDS